MSALSKVAKMLAKAADKGLDVSPQARKARAVEQGYMTNKDLVRMIQKNSRDEFYALDPAIKERIAYQNLGPDFDEEFLSEPAMFFHGTAGDISAFNPNMLGRSTKAASASHATFLTNLIDDADEYAKIAYENQPKRHRALELFGMLNDEMGDSQKFIERFNRYNMADHGMSSEAVEAAQRRIERLKDRMEMLTPGIEDQGAAVYPSYVRANNPLFIDKRGEGYGDITKSLSRAKQQGNDSVIFFDITDPTPGATHIAMFDPSRIRSINAMFDPERINSRDLLASMGSLGALGLTDEVLDEQEPEEYAAGGLVKMGSKILRDLYEAGVGTKAVKKINEEELRRIKELDSLQRDAFKKNEESWKETLKSNPESLELMRKTLNEYHNYIHNISKKYNTFDEEPFNINDYLPNLYNIESENKIYPDFNISEKQNEIINSYKDKFGQRKSEYLTFGSLDDSIEDILKRAKKGNAFSASEESMDNLDEYVNSNLGKDLFTIHNHPIQKGAKSTEVSPSFGDIGSFSYESLLGKPNFIITPDKKVSVYINNNRDIDSDYSNLALLRSSYEKISPQLTGENSLLNEYFKNTLPNNPELIEYFSTNRDPAMYILGRQLRNLGKGSIDYLEYPIEGINESDELFEDIFNEVSPKIKFASGGLVYPYE